MNFQTFASIINARFMEMCKNPLFVVSGDTDTLFNHYLDSYPSGTNEIYKENRQYDCNCCKSFIRRVGTVVNIDPQTYELSTVWDVEGLEGEFKVVAEAMSEYIKRQQVKSIFLLPQDEGKVSLQVSRQDLEDGNFIDWNHFWCEVPSTFLSSTIGTTRSHLETTVGVFKRGLIEITVDAVETTLSLCSTGSIYRGEEFQPTVESFDKLQKEFLSLDESKHSAFVWCNHKAKGVRVRNSAIGTLLQDLSDSMDLNTAVAKFEKVVAPESYKRTSAPVTKGMIDKALKTVEDLNIESSLHRRMATLADVNVNDVLWASKEASNVMKGSLASLLESEASSSKTLPKNTTIIGIEQFMTDVLPKAETLEVLVQNSHLANLCTLTAPQVQDSKSIFKWGNPFAWSYYGNITDSSIKQKVKTAGGSIDGALRVSLAWSNHDDLDLHIRQPNNKKIYFSSKHGESGGNLDVDMNANGRMSRTPVENVIWKNHPSMDGTYKVIVNQFSKRERIDVGCTVEVEFDGQLHSFSYPKALTGDTAICDITVKKGKISITKVYPGIESSTMAQEEWGIKTQQFIKVNTMMLSPNFWDGKAIGNKHYMFMLDGCKNPESVRGIYNEFLTPELHEHRKVFEILGDKTKCESTDDQLSGLGFSSTKRNEIVVRVKGKTQRDFTVQF